MNQVTDSKINTSSNLGAVFSYQTPDIYEWEDLLPLEAKAWKLIEGSWKPSIDQVTMKKNQVSTTTLSYFASNGQAFSANVNAEKSSHGPVILNVLWEVGI